MRFRRSLVLMVAVLATTHLEPVVADDGSRQYQFAKGLYAREQWEAASKEFESFLRDHSDHAEAAKAEFYLAEALVQNRRFADAAKRFQHYLETAPEEGFRKQALFRVAECGFLGNMPTAQQALETFSAAFPDDRLNGTVLAYRGQLALRQGKAEEAEALFRQAIERFPGAIAQDECRLGLARALELGGHPEDAERYYMALASKPNSPTAIEAKYRLASLRYARQEYASALEAFAELDQIPRSNPRAASAGLGKGWTLMKLGRMSDAAKVFGELAKQPAVAVQALYWLGLCQKAEKDWAGATKSLLAAAARLSEESAADKASSAGEVTRTAALFHAGDIQLAAGNLQEARRLFDQAIASAQPDERWLGDAQRAAVQTSVLLKDYDRARGDAERFLRDRSEGQATADLLRLLARAQLEQDDFEAAEQTLSRLGDGEPGSDETLENAYLLALACQGREDYEKALNVLQPVVQNGSGKLAADARLVEASLLIALKRYEKALESLAKYQAKAGSEADQPQALALTAVCHAQLGRDEEALRLYRQAFGDGAESGTLRWDTAEQIAETALNEKKYDQAEAMYRSMIEGGVKDDRKRRAMVGLAWTQHGRGENEAAASTLAGLGEAEVSAETLYLSGRVFRELGQTEPACQSLEKLIRDHPETDYGRDALWDLAQLYEQSKRPDQAAALYEKIVGLGPSHNRHVDALYNLAWLRQDEGKTKEAASLFRQIYTQHHGCSYWAHAALSLAQDELDAQRQVEAAAILEKVLNDDRGKQVRDRALYLAGQMEFAAGRWQQARQKFEQLVSECPESDLIQKAAFAAAEAAFHEKAPGSSALFERLLAENEDLADSFRATARMRLAQLYAEASRWDDAMSIADTFAADHPGFAQQYELDYVRGRCLAARAMFNEARQAYEKVIRSASGEKTETAAKAQLMIAETYFHQKRYVDAYRAYMKVEILYDYPELQAAALLQAGKCEELQNHPDRAAELYELVVKNYRNTRVAKEAASRLPKETHQALQNP